MKILQIDPNLFARNFTLELADLPEVSFVLRVSFLTKIFRPICKIFIRFRYKLVLISFILLILSPLVAEEEINSVIVCDNGVEMFAWDLQFIEQAQQSIEISGSICGGKLFRNLLSALDRRLQERPNLQIHLLSSSVLMEDEDRKVVRVMEKKYPRNFHFLVTPNVVKLLPDYSYTENHVKCVIVDERYFSAGGTNLEEMLCTEGSYTPDRRNKRKVGGTLFPLGSRDMDFVARGPMARQVREVFFKLYAVWEDYLKKGQQKLHVDPEFFKDSSRYWSLEGGPRALVDSFESSPKLIRNPKMKLLFSGPMHKPNRITEEYAQLVNLAKKEVVIGNLYFNPAKAILQAAMDAVNRNVKMIVITNGLTENSPVYNALFCWANRMNYVPILYGATYHFWEIFTCLNSPLKEANIYEYDVKDVVYHKKVMVVDKRYSIIGSYNLGLKSDRDDYETVFVFDSPEVSKEILRVLEVDISLSRPVSPQEARKWYFDPYTSYVGGTQQQFHGFI